MGRGGTRGATNAEATYYFDWTAPRDCSRVNTTKHFYAWTAAEAAAMGKLGPNRATSEEERVVWGSLRIPLTATTFLVLNGVRYCRSYSDNILSVTHVIAASNWIPTKDGLHHPSGVIFPLEGVTDHLELGIDYDERQLSLLRRLVIKTGVPHVPTRQRAESTRPAHEDVSLSGSLVLASMLPETMLRAIALSNVVISDVVDFLNNEVATNEGHWTKLPGWLEQPPYPSTPINNDAAIVAATRTDQPEPIDNRSFDLEAPPLRPSTSMVEARKGFLATDDSVLQRARVTDEVASV